MVLFGCNVFLENSFIMTVNNLLDVGCATVAYFHRVSVKYFPQFVANREAFFKQD